MTKLDWDKERAQTSAATLRPELPVGPAVRPARSGRRYATQRQAENAARYVNAWGQQRERFEWFVKPAEDGEGFELWRRPRVQPGRRR